jgi:hypothetical protein
MAEKKDKKDKKDKKKTKPKPKVSMKQTTKQTITINLAKTPAKRRRRSAPKQAMPTPGPIYITNPQPSIVPDPFAYSRFASMPEPVDYKRIESFIPKPADFARIEAPIDYPRIGDMIKETANMFIPPKPQVEYVPISESIPVTESTKTSRLTLRKPPIRKQLTEEQKERKRIYDRNRRQMLKQARSGTWEDTASIVEEEM